MMQKPDNQMINQDKGLELDCRLQLDDQQWHFQYQLPPVTIQGVVGHSGCGKTTLLRIIAGLETRAKGSVSFQEQVFQGQVFQGQELQKSERDLFIPAHLRPTVMVFQDVRLLGHISVEKNLLFAANNQQIVDSYWQTLVDVLGLQPMLSRRPSALSGGEKQRVGLARSLLSDAKLWLFDEPLSAVDNKHKAEILTFLKQHLAERQVQSLFVTHQHQELEVLQAPVIDLTNS